MLKVAYFLIFLFSSRVHVCVCGVIISLVTVENGILLRGFQGKGGALGARV
jgi:hypothetical protein